MIKNWKHHHFRVTITYGGKEECSRIYNNLEKAGKFAARQKKSPIVKTAQVEKIDQSLRNPANEMKP
jgi:hypothetical protein